MIEDSCSESVHSLEKRNKEMANMFAEIAKKATTLSPLMEGRNKIEMREIIAKYPNGITVNAFDMLGTGDESYPVFTFTEEPKSFAFGGAVFKSIVLAWIANFDGSISDASDALTASGGVKMLFEHTTTKQGRSLTNVRIPE